MLTIRPLRRANVKLVGRPRRDSHPNVFIPEEKNSGVTKKMAEHDGTAGSTPSFFDSVAALVTVKGVVLLLFLTVIAVASVATGEAVQGVLPGAALASLLVIAVIYEDIRNDHVDVVGVVTIVLATVYTGFEYIEVTQGMWFPLAAAFLLLATAGGVAWTKTEEDDPGVFVENLDVVGLHGGVLFVLYALIYLGASTADAPMDEILFSPILPVVLLFFVLSLLGTTVAYAARSPPIEVATNELHHKLVSVVRGLAEVEDDETREDLGQHVRSVAGSLSGVDVPSRVEVSDGEVPVVLPVSGQPVYEPHDVDDLLSELRERSLTGYAVHEDGNVLLAKEGKPVAYYVSPKDEFGTNPDVLPYGYFGDARVFTASYAFVDSVESVLPLGRSVEADEEAAGEESGAVEDAKEEVESVLGTDELPDEEEVEAEAEAIAEEKDAEEIFSESVEEEETVEEEGAEVEEDETEEETEDTEERKSESAFESDTDINEKLDDAGDMFE